MKSPLNTTLSANGSTDWYKCESGLLQLTLDATDGNGFGSGNIVLQKKSAQGNPITMAASNTAVTYTISQSVNVEVPQGSEWRATLASSTSPTLYVTLEEIADAPFRS